MLYSPSNSIHRPGLSPHSLMGKPTDQVSSANAVASGRKEDLQGTTSERKTTLVLGGLSRISCNSPLIGRFETRNVSTDNPRHAFYPRRREREDANPPHEQAEEGQMLPRRGTRNEAPICCYCPSLTSRKASLIRMCMHLDTAVEKRNRQLTHYHMRVVGA